MEAGANDHSDNLRLWQQRDLWSEMKMEVELHIRSHTRKKNDDF